VGWAWQLRREPGSTAAEGPAPDISEAFASRSEAETWIGEQWRALQVDGVVSVTLTHDDAVVGPALVLPTTEDS
jgi:hypothetical protein